MKILLFIVILNTIKNKPCGIIELFKKEFELTPDNYIRVEEDTQKGFNG